MSSGKVDKAWQELKVIQTELQSCQNPAGIVSKKNQGEARALEYQKKQVDKVLDKAAADFLKSHGFTAGGQKRKKRR